MIPASIPKVPLAAERSPWLRGRIRLPGDPALSSAALILAAMARGESVLDNMTCGPGAEAVASILRRLGARIDQQPSGWHVQGIGIGGFLSPDGPFDLGATGEAAPLLLGLLGGHDFCSELTGLGAVPTAEALLDFIARNGGQVERQGEIVRVRAPRFAIPFDLALSQEAQGLVAPLLLLALVTTGRSTLHLPDGVRDPIEDLLVLFGARLGAAGDGDVTRIMLEGMQPLRAQALSLPGDPTLAVYPAVAALIAPDSELTISAVALQPRGLALLDALALLGAEIAIGEVRRAGADITVRHSALTGTAIPSSLGVAPEDFPIIAVAAALAEGETLLDGLGEGVRRLALTRSLRANGIECVEQQGGLLVRGKARVAGGGNVITRLDPKLAMAFLVLGMAADQPVTIDDGAAMQELFPGFAEAFEHVGASFSHGSAA
jgi:3-phosphoshikimate 1-carboxyvinyltransferase